MNLNAPQPHADRRPSQSRVSRGVRGRGFRSGLRGGFSLIELLVTVSIVTVMLGITIYGVRQVRSSSRESQLRSILGGLTAIASQYEASTHQEVFHLDLGVFEWGAAKRRNVPGSTGTDVIDGDLTINEAAAYSGAEATRHENANLYSERFVWVALQVPDLATRLRGLGPDTLVDLDGDGFLELRDVWERNIAYGVRTSHEAETDDDFLPNHPNPFFASAGVDGLWGESRVRGEFASDAAYAAYLGSDDGQNARDNLYSFDIDRTATEAGQ